MPSSTSVVSATARVVEAGASMSSQLGSCRNCGHGYPDVPRLSTICMHAVGVVMYRAQSVPRQCSEHQKLVNEEINAWEAYDGLKLALANEPVTPELAEELDRRYKEANEASEEVKYHAVW